MNRFGAFLAAAVMVGEALAQQATPARLLGELAMLLVVAERCEIALPPERRAAISAAGERVQARAGATNATVEVLVDVLGRHALTLDCDEVRAAYDGKAVDVLARAERD